MITSALRTTARTCYGSSRRPAMKADEYITALNYVTQTADIYARAHGRYRWNYEDYKLATEEIERLLRREPEIPKFH